jgi:hypothetical protein
MRELQNDIIVTDEYSSSEVQDNWDMVVVGRIGKPPLRYKGRKTLGIVRGHSLFIDVWSRLKGDYVLAYSDFVAGQIKPQAIVASDLNVVAQLLEDLCEQPVFTQVKAFPIVLADMLQTLRYQQQFAILVGEFLAQLDAQRTLHNASQKKGI